MNSSNKNRAPILAALASAVFAWLLVAATVRDMGPSWDETIDIGSAKAAREWFGGFIRNPGHALREETVAAYWENDWKQHPAATRIVHGVLASLFLWKNPSDPIWTEWLAWRLAAAVPFAALTGLVFLTAWRHAGGWAAGLTAAVALVGTPRLFGHGHLVETDVMQCLFHVAAAVAFLRGLESKLGAAAFGALAGALPAVKFTGFFGVAILLGWGVFMERKRARSNLLCAAVIGPPVFFALQPMTWGAPVSALKEYLLNFRNPGAGVALATRYFGVDYPVSPPPSYPFAMIALTVPLVVLVFAGAGVLMGCLKNESRKSTGFFLMNALAFPALFALPGVPGYDGERLFLPAFPFLAVLAGRGLSEAVERFPRASRAAVPAAFAFCCAAALSQARPFYLCHYNELAGGPAGAAKRGLEAIYWGEVLTPDFTEAMNRKLPRSARLSASAIYPPNLEFMQRLGLLRGDFQFVPYGSEADFAVAANRSGVLDPYLRELMRNGEPLAGVEWRGARLAGAFLLPPGLRFFEGKGEVPAD